MSSSFRAGLPNATIPRIVLSSPSNASLTAGNEAKIACLLWSNGAISSAGVDVSNLI